MDFLFEVAGLSVPLVQEIVFLIGTQVNILDCLKPPYYFIPKNSIPIENHAGHNLAQHAKLQNPKWIGVPTNTSKHTIKEFIEKVLGQNVELTICTDRIIYNFKSDKQLLLEQSKKYNWTSEWIPKTEEQKCRMFNKQNRLIYFFHTNNPMTNIDVYPFTQLKDLRINKTQVKALDVRQCTQLQILYCDTVPIKELDVTQCTQLQQLTCCNTNIQELDVTQCTQLNLIYCHNTPIQELDVTQCILLETLHCYSTEIKELNVTQCTQIVELDCCRIPELKELNINQCTQLMHMYCQDTQIKELDISHCTQLYNLYCSKDTKLNGDLSNIYVTRY